MFNILLRKELADRVLEYEVHAPLVASNALPGNFVLVRGDEFGERIPLTIADSDAEKGSITLVMQVIGHGTKRLSKLQEGDSFLDIVGPLGKGREIKEGGRTICCVAGGLGVAPLYPQTKAYHEAGNKVISIIGSRNKDLFFWQDRMEAVSDKVLYSTDDGSFGHHGYATQLLEQLINEGEKIDEVIAIGPLLHMKAVTEVCKKYNIPVIVSMNPIMIDGTGMCGGCRVTVGGEVKYACVDGPEFDGYLIDFDEAMARQQAFKEQEMEDLQKDEGGQEKHICRLEEQVKNLNKVTSEDKEIPPLPQERIEGEIVKFIGESLVRIAKKEGKFDEVALGLTVAQAKEAASRCLLCANPSCVTGCPVEVDIPGFIKCIQEGNIKKAAQVLKDKNSLPAICGRVCPQETQCEQVCILAKHGKPVQIGALERFAADWEAEYAPTEPDPVPSNGIKIAVVGSGPGGLTCAGDLAKMGYEVTIFEAFHDTGGVLRYGIPEFRLPKTIVDREVDYVKKLGVTIELDVVVGKSFTVNDLLTKMGFEAVFIAVGAGAPVFMGIPGENLINVLSANEFLTRVNLMKAYREEYDTPVPVGEQVAVIGAGNVAMDAARTAKRLGAKTVTIIYRRSREEMPARAAEIEHAQQEGIEFLLLANPVRILGDEENRVNGIECIRMELGEPDESGRRRPIPVKGSEFVVPCDMVIPALGNRANPLLTSSTEGLELNKWGNIVADENTCATSIPGVFAGGDIVIGAATVIEAMGAGKRAARGIHEYITKKKQAITT